MTLEMNLGLLIDILHPFIKNERSIFSISYSNKRWWFFTESLPFNASASNENFEDGLIAFTSEIQHKITPSKSHAFGIISTNTEDPRGYLLSHLVTNTVDFGELTVFEKK